jgi:uncharacterized protein
VSEAGRRTYHFAAGWVVCFAVHSGVETTARIALREDRSLRLVAISDTHSQPHPASVERVVSLRPDAILHGGDIGNLSVLDSFAEIAPLHAVRGNIDAQVPGIPDVILLDLVHGETLALRILLIHLAVYGPRLRAEVARKALATGASLVVCGHSHVPFIGRDRGVTVFNPGSIGPRRVGLPIVFGTIDVAATGVRLAHVDCETGQRWTPPPC